MNGSKRARIVTGLVAVGLLAAVGLPWGTGQAYADGSDSVAFMGVWNTEATSLNEDSWIFGGPSPVLDIELEGSARIGVFGSGELGAILRNSTVKWGGPVDYSDYLAWLDEPEETRGPNPCGTDLHNFAELTAANGDQVFFESTGGRVCVDGGTFAPRFAWKVTGGTGEFEGATGKMESWGSGAGGLSRDVVLAGLTDS